MARNRLDQETSPYLLAHRTNPVHWQPWDEAALAEAQKLDKPILLSVGYTACHWCHVMARESFEDPDTAKLMNSLFVNIKVDREERPDIDNIYQSALAELGQQRGWPLTMFLTPQAKPYGGGTYFPPTTRFGQPAFRDVLRSMADAYANTSDDVVQTSAKLVQALETEARGAAGGEITTTLLNHVANQTLDGVDIVYGGFGQRAKFPFPMALELLWRAHYRVGHNSFRDAVMLTVEHMCLGGIYDHLGGGFSRYTVDDQWLVPHFEKMLYDNALLIDLLTLLWRGTGRTLLADRIEATVGWLLREMTVPGGGFAASLAADSDGYGDTPAGEGNFYVWRETEIDAVLGVDSPVFKDHYDVDSDGNWEGRCILNRRESPVTDDTALEDHLAALRNRLWIAREKRPRPRRDDKVLTDWNGMAAAALAHAGTVFKRADWLGAAAKAFAFVSENLADNGRLRHSIRNDRVSEASLLDDHAQMARAALCLFEASGDSFYVERAEQWADIANRRYWDENGSGYFLTADDAPATIARIKTARETSTPSGNGTMVGVLARLHALTGKEAYRKCATATVAAFSADVPVHFFAMATLLNSSQLLRDLVQIVVLGEPNAPEREGLLRVAYQTACPDRLLVPVAPDADLSAEHPAAGKTTIQGKATAYVCVGNTCRLPITDPQALQDVLGPTANHPA